MKVLEEAVDVKKITGSIIAGTTISGAVCRLVEEGIMI